MNATHISVTFSLSSGTSGGMLVIRLGSRHCSMANEQRHARGHPPRAGAGDRLKMASTRGKSRARARAAISTGGGGGGGGGSAQHEQAGMVTVELESEGFTSTAELSHAPLRDPSWSGSGTTAGLSSRRGSQASRLRAPGDMLVVGWSLSLSPSLLHVKGGATAESHQTPPGAGRSMREGLLIMRRRGMR